MGVGSLGIKWRFTFCPLYMMQSSVLGYDRVINSVEPRNLLIVFVACQQVARRVSMVYC